MYPISLDIHDRRGVVVGGGPVAARRTAALVNEGAVVEVIAPFICEDLADLLGQERATWTPRDYVTGDLGDAWLVHTATGVPDIDAMVAADAEADRIWCVRADDASASAAWIPAVARAGNVTVAVTAGGDPRRSVRIRNVIQHQLTTGSLPVRRQRAVGGVGRESGAQSAAPGREALFGEPSASRHTPPTAGFGKVALVGGGPGDPGLITTRGRRLLAEADVVVVDRLAPRSLLDDLDEDVEVIDVGKTPGHHPVPQDRINDLLIEEAQRGRQVVRLKGGDPFVLGRGGEEVAACRDAGIDVEVVPGVTSAVGVPAAVGIPVTHRGLAKQVTIVSGHEDLDWSSLAGAQGTLVFLMGVSLLRATAAALIGHGMPPATPVGIIEDGYGPEQRLTTGSLADIADRADAAGVQPPAVIVVGDVVSLAYDSSGDVDGHSLCAMGGHDLGQVSTIVRRPSRRDTAKFFSELGSHHEQGRQRATVTF